MTVIERIAAYALSVSRSAADERVPALAKQYFMDAFGCILIGSRQEGPRSAMRYIEDFGGPETSTVLGFGVKTDACSAALVNGISCQCCDFDDIGIAFNGHSSTVVLPAALAVGEKLGSTGEEVLTAYIAGVEIDGILGSLVAPAQYSKAWNPTTTIGTLGAAAAVGKLMRLTQEQMVHALGMAVNEAGGLKINFGYSGKDFAVGNAAAKAIQCAQMALYGLEANPEALDGGEGYLAATTQNADADVVRDMIETGRSVFISPGILMKPYPSCRGNHSGIDCMLHILENNRFDMEDIDRIRCKLQDTAWDNDRFHHPATPSQAKFSLSYCIAKLLTNKKIAAEDFTGDTISDPDGKIAYWIDKVEIERDDSFVDARFGAEVIVTLKEGRSFSCRSCYAKGDPNNPITQEEIVDKFYANCRSVYDRGSAKKLVHMLERLEELQFIGQLTGIQA